ncbi:hypothetical protein BaRGS_00036637 [Batillaria attramentaria]|uniref:MAM domain-containing protein n=1 Tax=Batillaria attramentaria TaxID=370345 RepID=A0ABD0JBT2_9CAEN
MQGLDVYAVTLVAVLTAALVVRGTAQTTRKESGVETSPETTPTTEAATTSTVPSTVVTTDTACMTVNFRNKSKDSVARLQSPWLCTTGQNSALRFKYAIAGLYGDKMCPLSVNLTTSSGTSRIWKSPMANGATLKRGKSDIPNSGCPFKIVFEAQKLKDNDCGPVNDEINIANVVFEGVQILPQTTPTSEATTTSTVSPTVVTEDPTNPGTREPVSHALRIGVGTRAAIGVGAVVIIILVIAVIVVLRTVTRKSEQDKPNLLNQGTDGHISIFRNHSETPDDTNSSARGPPTQGHQEVPLSTPAEHHDNTMATPEYQNLMFTSGNYENILMPTPGYHENTMATPEHYEPLRTRPDTGNRASLTALETTQAVTTEETYENYEPLSARSDTADYTTLAGLETAQPGPAEGNYESLMNIRPEDDMYTTLTQTE